MLVMERGEALDEYAKRCMPGFASSMQIVLHLTRRFADLHLAGYVHRDVKPSNTLWLPSKNAWMLCDFASCARIGTTPRPSQHARLSMLMRRTPMGS